MLTLEDLMQVQVEQGMVEVVTLIQAVVEQEISEGVIPTPVEMEEQIPVMEAWQEQVLEESQIQQLDLTVLILEE